MLSCIRECGWAVRTETACLTPPLTFLQVVQSLWELQLRVVKDRAPLAGGGPGKRGSGMPLDVRRER